MVKLLNEDVADKILNEETIIFEKLHESLVENLLIALNHIVEDELNPLRYVNFEQFVIFYQIDNHLVYRAVHLIEFLSLVCSLFKYLLLFVFLHEEKQLEKQLAQPQILADFLPFRERRGKLFF